LIQPVPFPVILSISLTMESDMKALLLCALTPVVFSSVALSESQTANSASARAPQTSAAVSPFYCDKSALDPVRRTRHFDVLGPELVAKRLRVRELSDGYEFEFPVDSLFFQHLTEWIDGERECCPFFDITLRVAPEHHGLTMRVTGRPGTKQFIQADGAEWLGPISAAK
jgi:hypothetical protein